MRLNRTSVWKVMTLWISREVPLFNFEPLDILCPWIGHPCEKLWAFELVESFRCLISGVSIYYVPESDIRVKFYDHSNISRASVVKFWASKWVMSPNRTSGCKLYDHWNLSRASVVQFLAYRYIMSPNQTFVWNVMTIWICWELPLFNFERHDIFWPRIGHPCQKLWPFEFLGRFCCSISSVSIYYAPESDIRVKNYDQ